MKTEVTKHVVGELIGGIQRCLICGYIISDYRNAIYPEGTPKPTGFPSGAVYVWDINPIVMTTEPPPEYKFCEAKNDETFMHPCKIFVDSNCDCIGECGNEVAWAWQDKAKEVSYEYAGDYIAGVEDFKLALKKELTKEKEQDDGECGKGLQRALELIESVKPVNE